MEPKILYLNKASPVLQSEPIQEIHLKFCKDLPGFNDSKEAAHHYDNEAQDIFETLVNVLPGGVLDRLLAKLLSHKASLFTVPYGENNGN